MSSPTVSTPVAHESSSPDITNLLQPFVDQGTMAGAVTLVATMDRILSLDTVGYADLAARKPMVPDQMFWIASMTKPMTAAALMMLVDEGRLSVEDPVEKYLPEFKSLMVVAEKSEEHLLLRKPDHPALVREILSHTAGLVFSAPVETPTFDRLSLDLAVRSYAMTPLQFQPGTTYSYSNAGTNTAGRLIEVLSGMSYEAFMQERLFTPLGMKDTTFWPDDEQSLRLAKIYRANAGKTGLEEAPLTQLSYPFNNPARKPLAAGGLFSTAADCLEFCRMVLNGGEYRGRRYLSEAAVRQMTTKQTGDAVEEPYGFCWSTANGNFGHGGAYKTNMTVNPRLGIISIFLVQQASEWPNGAEDKIFPLFMAAAENVTLP